MKNLSIRARLTLQWTLSFGLLLLAANVAIFVGTRAFLVRDLDAQLRTLAGTELASAFDNNLGVHLHDFPADTFNPGEFADKFVQLLSPDGRVLMQSARLGSTPPLVSDEALREAVRGVSPIFSVRATGRPGRMTALATSKGGDSYVVAVGLFTDPLERTLSALATLLAMVWFAGVGFTALLGLLIARQALEPVHRITQRAATIAKGNFSARLDDPAVDDEMGRMTRLLNHMLDRLHAAIQANQRFAADASHELRTPLTAMLGEIDVTLKRDRPSEEYRETLAITRERIEELAQLTESLMLLVRAQEGHAGPLVEVSLTAAVGAAVARVEASAESRHIAIRIADLPDLIAYADPRLLARVFDNVLRNAVQYNVDGGLIAISGRATDPGPGDWTAGAVTIAVRDTGPGITEADRDRIFDRFYRTDQSRSRRTGGAGLGLAICREVMTLLNGAIRIAETSPEGTTFEITMPGGVASARRISGTMLTAGVPAFPPVVH